MNIELYNKSIKARTHYCALEDCDPSPVEEPYINLYVKFSGCNAHCPFCIDDCKKKAFDVDKLTNIVEHLKDNVKVRKVSFTGG